IDDKEVQRRAAQDEKNFSALLEAQNKFLANQRKINGRLCRAVWVVLDALEIQSGEPDPVPNKHRDTARAIQDARKFILKIADVMPPGCDPRDPSKPPPS